MEQGDIKDFTETDKIDRVRRAHAQRHTFIDQDTNKHALKRNNNRSMVCQYYTPEIPPNTTHTKQRGFYTDKSVLFVSQRLAKASNILRLTVKTSKDKKNE